MSKGAYRALLIALLVISGCGGGGGDTAPQTPPAVTKVTLTFSTLLASDRTDTFGSVEFTAYLPAGVTIPADSDGAIDNENLMLIDKALAVPTRAILGRYTPPSDGVPAKVHVAVIALGSTGDSAGMAPGPFATLTCDVAPGSHISASAFPQPGNVVVTDSAGVAFPTTDANVRSVATLQ